MNTPIKSIARLTLEQEALIDRHIEYLRSETQSLSAPAMLGAKLNAAFAQHHAKRRTDARWRDLIAHWFAPGFALAASAGMAAWMVFSPMARTALDAFPATPVEASANGAADGPFIALQSLEQIALEPHPRIIETDIPRMLLASYGVPVNPEFAGGLMRAEMLVSASGQPLAMRFAH
jgi:hypothetical protein